MVYVHLNTWLHLRFFTAAVASGAFLRADPPVLPVSDPAIFQLVQQVSAKNIETSVRTLVGFRTRHTLSPADHPKEGIGAARNWIRQDFEKLGTKSGGRLVVSLDRFTQAAAPPRISRTVEITNVVATLRGKLVGSAERIYVVAAHYDSRPTGINDMDTTAPGADNNASGVAAVMELARVLSPHEFDATLVFLALGAGEQGLQGSEHWAKSAKAQGWNIAGMFNLDVIGSPTREDETIRGNVVRLFAEGVPITKSPSEDVLEQLRTGGENDFPSRQLARAIKEAAEVYVPQMAVRVIYRRDRYFRNGDQAAFLDAGFAAVRLTEPEENFAHQHQDVREEDGLTYGDIPEYLDFNYIAQVGRIAGAALANMAAAPAPPRDVTVETASLSNDTHLHWESEPANKVASYRVVWRETTSPFWEHAIDVGNVSEFVLAAVSKDNVIFGVKAVDAAGHFSTAVYPRPFRQK